MAIPTATVTFTRGVDSVTLNTPVPRYATEHRRAQSRGQTASGAWRVYDKGVTLRVLRVSLELTEAQRASLSAFFDDVLAATEQTFSYLDHLGETHAGCKLQRPMLDYGKTAGGRQRVDLDIITSDTAD